MMGEIDERIPAILVDGSSWSAHEIFRSNDWRGESKPIIISALAQFALLLHTSSAASEAVDVGNRICSVRFENLQRQWRQAKWDFPQLRYFVEVPAVHQYIHAFLAAGKTLLDLLAQLVTTEGVVIKKVDGFHKKADIVGGELLSFLTIENRKVAAGRQLQAAKLYDHLKREKTTWIDTLVKARDNMAHPRRGMVQSMWELEVIESEGLLQVKHLVRPQIGGLPFDEYVHTTFPRIRAAVDTYLQLVKAS